MTIRNPLRTGSQTGTLGVSRPTRFCLLLAALVVWGVVWGAPALPAQVPPPADSPTEFTVLLQAPSVGEQLRGLKSKAQAGLQPHSVTSVGLMRRAVVRRQAPVRTEIEALGVDVLGSASNVLNAIFVRATPTQARALADLPGVRGVVRGQRYQPMLRSVAEIVSASSAYMRPKGEQLYGEGLKVAIIDSGLDFDHEAFRDPGLPRLEGYPLGDPRYLHLTNSKVIVVRSYIESLVSREPASSTPDDPSPMDLSGHGTAVAMVAVGRSLATPLGAVMGIAPKARLGVYKVFGSPGLNSYTADHVVVAAIDDAVADGMDILNLSLGNPEIYPWDATGRDCDRGPVDDPCNPVSLATHSAVHDFDRVVVAAAGNHGLRGSHAVPALNTLLAPANTPAVITVGGTGNAAERQVSVRIGDQQFVAASGMGPDADGPLTAMARQASDLGNALGCAPYPEQALGGRIAVIERGDCLFVDKVEHADAAGARGVLVVNHVGDALVSMALLERTDIPAFFVGKSDGASIRQLLVDPLASLTLDPRPVETEKDWAFVAASSSRGPSLALLPKPDLVAPGQSVYTAAPRYNDEGILFAPSGFRELSGTSFAAPVVAGAAALVWQAFPALTARQVASVLINTARPVLLEDGTRETVLAAGAGVLDLSRALHPIASVVPPSIGFGSVREGAFPVTRQLEISNPGPDWHFYSLKIVPRDLTANASLTVNGRSVYQFRLGPGRSRTVAFRLGGSRPAPGAYEGHLLLTSLDGMGELTVPYLYVVGSNDPTNAIRLRGHPATGFVGQAETKSVVARVLDQHGVPVVGQPVHFRLSDPSMRLVSAATRSGPNGLIHARVRYSASPDPQVVTARVGSLEIPFEYQATRRSPVVLSVVNSASRAAAPGLVAGSMATIRGFGLAPHASGPWPSPQVRALPITRKGTSVAFDGLNREFSIAGPIYAVAPDTVTVQVPWEAARVSKANLKVRAQHPSSLFQFELARVAPGIFHYESGGRSYALALHADSSAVTVAAPAARGSEVNIAMTGNGPVVLPPTTGAAGGFSNPTVNFPTVWIGGQRASVIYSGLDPELAGAYLVTVGVPWSISRGEHVLRVEFDGVMSNEVLLPVH